MDSLQNKSTNSTFKGTPMYMAPEIYQGLEYKGHGVDLFAAGVLLFMLLTIAPPFEKAVFEDLLYKPIVVNRYDIFWRNHLKSFGSEGPFVSESGMELISMIFNYDSVVRPSLAEIREHEWCKLPAATHEEVVEWFTKSRDIIDQKDMTNDAPVPNKKPDENVYETKSVTRGIGDEEVKIVLADRQAKIYDRDFERFTQFFSDSKISDLYDTLTCFAIDYTYDYTFSAEDYSCRMKVIDETSSVSLQVNILKVPDQEKYGVEVFQEAGNKFLFNKTYKKLKLYFGGHANATF